jgi:hypothetical protein
MDSAIACSTPDSHWSNNKIYTKEISRTALPISGRPRVNVVVTVVITKPYPGIVKLPV